MVIDKKATIIKFFEEMENWERNEVFKELVKDVFSEDVRLEIKQAIAKYKV